MARILFEEREEDGGAILVGGCTLPEYVVYKGRKYLPTTGFDGVSIEVIADIQDTFEVAKAQWYRPNHKPTDPTPLDDLNEADVNLLRAA